MDHGILFINTLVRYLISSHIYLSLPRTASKQLRILYEKEKEGVKKALLFIHPFPLLIFFSFWTYGIVRERGKENDDDADEICMYAIELGVMI